MFRLIHFIQVIRVELKRLKVPEKGLVVHPPVLRGVSLEEVLNILIGDDPLVDLELGDCALELGVVDAALSRCVSILKGFTELVHLLLQDELDLVGVALLLALASVPVQLRYQVVIFCLQLGPINDLRLR